MLNVDDCWMSKRYMNIYCFIQLQLFARFDKYFKQYRNTYLEKMKKDPNERKDISYRGNVCYSKY